MARIDEVREQLSKLASAGHAGGPEYWALVEELTQLSQQETEGNQAPAPTEEA